MRRRPSVKLVRVETYVNKNTGEAVDLSTYSVPDNIKPIFLDKENIPTKAKDPFFRVNYMNTKEITQEEKALLFDLVHMIGWENNYIQKDGRYLNISELAKEIGISRQYVSRILTNLEKKNYLFLRGNAREKSIYLNSDYVWKGNEKNRTNTL
jgi:hypothetical protein